MSISVKAGQQLCANVLSALEGEADELEVCYKKQKAYINKAIANSAYLVFPDDLREFHDELVFRMDRLHAYAQTTIAVINKAFKDQPNEIVKLVNKVRALVIFADKSRAIKIWADNLQIIEESQRANVGDS